MMRTTRRMCQLTLTCGFLAGLGHAADVTVGAAKARTGQKATGYIEVPAGVDAATNLPVIVINGATAGPTLALFAGAHGTEYASSCSTTRARAGRAIKCFSGF